MYKKMRKFVFIILTISGMLIVMVAPVAAQAPLPCPANSIAFHLNAGDTFGGIFYPSETDVCILPTSAASTVTNLTIDSVVYPIAPDGNIFLPAEAIDALKAGSPATLYAAEDVILNHCGPNGCFNGENLVKAGTTCQILGAANESSGMRVLNEIAVNTLTGNDWEPNAKALFAAMPRIYTPSANMTCTP